MNVLALSLCLASAAPTAAVDDTTVPTSAAWRAERPKTGDPKPPKLPVFQKTTLDNGLTVLVTELDALPIVSFSLVTNGGAMLDPKGKAGLASITYDMLQEGTDGMSALELSDAVADLGASFGAGGDRDRGSVSIGGLSKNGEAMMKLLAAASLTPKFAADDFDRVKKRRLAALIRRRGSPQGAAFERVPALIYGADHPYGHPPSGTVETVQTINVEDTRQAFKRMMSPGHSALIAAGALSLDEVKALAEKHFGAWKAEVPALPEVPEAPARPRTAVHLLDKPGVPQTMTIIGRPLFAKGHPDEAALTLANEIYGGAFSSRLNMNLREEKSITYGAGSQASFRQGTGVFIGYAAIKAEDSALGLSEFMRELDRMASEPPTAVEVEAARSGLIKSLSGSFETSGAIASAASALFVYGLPLDYYQSIAKKYDAADLAAVQKAAKDYLVGSTMQILLVGDAAVIGKPIEDLGLGKLEVTRP